MDKYYENENGDICYEYEKSKQILEYKIIENIYREAYYACRLKIICKNKDEFIQIKDNEEVKIKYSFNNKG